MAKMKDKAGVLQNGRATSANSTTKNDMAGLKKTKGIKTINIKPQYDEWVFPGDDGKAGHSVMILAEGRLMTPQAKPRCPKRGRP